jgi:ATP/ADP translocase
LDVHQPPDRTHVYGRPVGVLVASLLLLAIGAFLAVTVVNVPRQELNPMLPATVLMALVFMATALGTVTRRSWARWIGMVLGLLAVLLGGLVIFIVTIFATGMDIPLTSELYTGPATFGTVTIVTGLITLVGLARSGSWYQGTDATRSLPAR